MSIVMYTTSTCPYCNKARALLRSKGVRFEEIHIKSVEEREIMKAKAGGRNTVPQIFIGDYHVGGCDDLHALDASGELDKLLEALKD